jgi:hypothetical protein
MRRIMELRLSQLRRKRPPRTVYVGSHEDKLSRLGAMRIDPDDDARTGEDVVAEKAYARRGAGEGGITFYS